MCDTIRINDGKTVIQTIAEFEAAYQPTAADYIYPGNKKIEDKNDCLCGIDLRKFFGQHPEYNGVYDCGDWYADLPKRVRHFEDLIKEIEVDGKKFIPMVEIAQLCFNYNEDAVRNDATMFVNSGYDFAAKYRFVTKIAGGCTCLVLIFRDFTIWTDIQVNKNPKEASVRPAANQVKIFFLLLKWGFIQQPEK